MERKCMRI
jgi:serine/threonine protein kinase